MMALQAQEQIVVFRVEEAEAGIGAAFVVQCPRELVEFVAPVARVLDGGQELQVAAVTPPLCP